MKIIKDKITIHELKKIAESEFGNLVKVTVDVEKKIVVFGGELHSDQEATLLEQGSKQQNLWGINIYPEKPKKNWIEFDSMINLRPSQGNRSRGVEDPKIRNKITKIINSMIPK